MNSPLLASERIIAVPNELPVPMNAGGRVDTWRRLTLLKHSGATLGLLTWYDGPRDGPPNQAQRDVVAQVCDALHLACITRRPMELLQRLLHAGRLPSHAASRWVTLDKPAALAWARSFRPTLLLADGLYGVAVVRWLAAELGVPWIYRSHNIEHRYMGMQMAQATRLTRRLGLMANRWALEQFERAAVTQARLVLDISASDMRYWQAQGIQHICWVPPIVDQAFTAALSSAASSAQPYDALYFGNLNTPNNVEGVRWLVKHVLPRIADIGLKVAIAGSKPTQEVVDLVASDERLSLIANPADIAEVVAMAKVLLNPVRGGSGVNLKSVEMLFSDAQLLSTTVGVQGLPGNVAGCFQVADEPEAFAALLDALRHAGPASASDLQKRTTARQVFTPAALAASLAQAVSQSRLQPQQSS